VLLHIIDRIRNQIFLLFSNLFCLIAFSASFASDAYYLPLLSPSHIFGGSVSHINSLITLHIQTPQLHPFVLRTFVKASSAYVTSNGTLNYQPLSFLPPSHSNFKSQGYIPRKRRIYRGSIYPLLTAYTFSLDLGLYPWLWISVCGLLGKRKRVFRFIRDGTVVYVRVVALYWLGV